VHPKGIFKKGQVLPHRKQRLNYKDQSDNADKETGNRFFNIK
jgi:hypothetical protein